MTNKKGTKRSLLMSALAMLLCVSMLIGSTFAWFTDSVASGSNIIKSGKLEVALLDAAGESLEGKPLEKLVINHYSERFRDGMIQLKETLTDIPVIFAADGMEFNV